MMGNWKSQVILAKEAQLRLCNQCRTAIHGSGAAWPLAKQESTGQKALQKNITFSRSFWYLTSIFIFYFLFLFERARHLHGAFGYVWTAGQGHESCLTLAQLHVSKLPRCGSRTAVALKEGFETSPGFRIASPVMSVAWGSLVPNSLCGNLISYAFIAPSAISSGTSWHKLLRQFLNCSMSSYEIRVACFLKEILKRLQLFARAVCDTGTVYEAGKIIFTSCVWAFLWILNLGWMRRHMASQCLAGGTGGTCLFTCDFHCRILTVQRV